MSGSLSSSDDELRLIQEEENRNKKQQLMTPRAKAKKKQSLEPAYVPQEDELDSPEENDTRPVSVSQKRKFDTETAESEAVLLGNNAPQLKKINTAPPSFSITSETTTLSGNTGKQTITSAPSQQSTASPGASSTASIQSSLLTIVHSTRKKPALYEDSNYVAESDDEDREIEELEKAYVIPENERATVMFDFDRERDKRLAGVVNVPEGMYTEKEKALFLQLAMRGFEPLAPKHWRYDFPTLPDSLFPESGKEKSDPIIKISRSTTFYAIKSLGNLFSLSARVRDCSIVEKRPEALIKQTINKYIRWALYDVDLEINADSMPIHVIRAQRENESVRDALEHLNTRLKTLALRHQKALAEAFGTGFGNNEASISNEDKDIAPLLIGFLICGPVVALITYDMSLMNGGEDNEEIDGKFFSQFDFSERGQDVWNSLSITIIAMHIRNTMVRLSENNYGGFVKSSRSSATSEDR
ncbi:hypothetical protein BDW62DRAFT_178344 [Aspergillus aurantiobrunneus]